MSSSTDIPRPSAKMLVTGCLVATKEALMNCCTKVQQQTSEQINFASDPTKKKSRSSHELTEFGTFEKQPSFDEFGCGSGERITEWQAGWNVTNAIQVGTFIHFIWNPVTKKKTFT